METPSPKGDLTPQRPNRRKSKAKVHRATDRLVGQVYAAQVQRNVVFFNFKDVFFSKCSFHFFKGLSDYVDDDLIQATSRELRSAMNVSPGALNAAVETLVKRKPSGKVTIPINLLSILFPNFLNPTNSVKQHLSVSQMSNLAHL